MIYVLLFVRFWGGGGGSNKLPNRKSEARSVVHCHQATLRLRWLVPWRLEKPSILWCILPRDVRVFRINPQTIFTFSRGAESNRVSQASSCVSLRMSLKKILAQIEASVSSPPTLATASALGAFLLVPHFLWLDALPTIAMREQTSSTCAGGKMGVAPNYRGLGIRRCILVRCC